VLGVKGLGIKVRRVWGEVARELGVKGLRLGLRVMGLGDGGLGKGLGDKC